MKLLHMKNLEKDGQQEEGKSLTKGNSLVDFALLENELSPPVKIMEQQRQAGTPSKTEIKLVIPAQQAIQQQIEQVGVAHDHDDSPLSMTSEEDHRVESNMMAAIGQNIKQAVSKREQVSLPNANAIRGIYDSECIQSPVIDKITH